VAQGQWQLAAALYVLAVVGFSGGNIFYDALLVGVAPPERRDSVSALGYSLGYLGGGLLFALNIAMTIYPASFGLESVEQAVRLSLASVALWWAGFSLPLFLLVEEQGIADRQSGWQAARAGLTQLAHTFGQVRRLKVVGLFLLAYWLYIDGVDTIINMAVDYGLSLGFSSPALLTALLITQFVGFPATLALGRLSRRLGPKPVIMGGLVVYLGVTLWGYGMRSEAEFYALAVIIGLVQGGVQALSRSFYARLIPASQAAQFFGFYNMLGKFAAVLGPLLMGWVSLATGNPRCSIIAVLLLFIPGILLLALVKEKQGTELAGEMEQ
jgi:UMF1 family MFS transporter